MAGRAEDFPDPHSDLDHFLLHKCQLWLLNSSSTDFRKRKGSLQKTVQGENCGVVLTIGLYHVLFFSAPTTPPQQKICFISGISTGVSFLRLLKMLGLFWMSIFFFFFWSFYKGFRIKLLIPEKNKIIYYIKWIRFNLSFFFLVQVRSFLCGKQVGEQTLFWP